MISKGHFYVIPDTDTNDLLSLRMQSDTLIVNGRTYTIAYDNANLRFTSTTPMGRQTVSRIDGKGRLTCLRADPSVLPVTFTYDGMGRLAKAGQDNNLWTYVYDDGNRLWKQIDPMDNVVEYGYDSADRVDMVKLPSGRTYGFAYDGAGNRTQVTMPSGTLHGLGYSPVNLDNVYTPPANPSYSHFYSLDREWIRTTLPSARQVTASYDPTTGRQDSVFYPEGSITYGYADYTDRLFSLNRTGSDNMLQTINFDYDGFLTTKVAVSGTTNGQFLYAYDNNFWTTGVALDNSWNMFSRDNDGLLTGYGPFTFGRGGPAGAPVNVSDLISRTCALDNAGLPAPCPSGTLDQQYGYDSFGRVNRRTQAVNGTPVYEAVLDRDPVGRIVRKAETQVGVVRTYDYTYDLDGQLFEVRRDGTLVERYGYDNNSNRTSTLTATATYDEQDRLIQQGGISYQIDVDGFLVHRAGAGGHDGGGPGGNGGRRMCGSPRCTGRRGRGG